MKLLKKLILSLIITLSIILLSQIIIPEFSASSIVQAANIKISKAKYTMNKGETFTLKIKNTKKTVKWSSNNKKVATVSSKGKVTAKSKGSAVITAKVGKKKYTCKIKVETPKINSKNVSLYVNKTYNLKISGTSQAVKWSSNNKKVATVSSKGKVSTKSAGTAIITAKVGNKKYTCEITVKKQVSNITVGQSNALKSAQRYLQILSFSKEGLKSQLEYEKFTSSEIDYAIKNCNANWNEEAYDCAKNYLDIFSFSRDGLYNQLAYEGFTDNQIKYALAKLGF